MGTEPPRPVVFLDRDGVLIENLDLSVRSWEDVRFFPRAFEACLLLTRANLPIVVVTNQAIVGRGIVGYDEVYEINRRILERFTDAGVNILASYICPHRPEDYCDCRKPKPGMIRQAVKDYNIDLAGSCFIGDALTDMQAADAAGIPGLLVRTGRGSEQERAVHQLLGGRCPAFGDVLEAVIFGLSPEGPLREPVQN